MEDDRDSADRPGHVGAAEPVTAADPTGAAARRPASVVRATQVIWLIVAVATVGTVLAVVLDDDVIATWVGGQGSSPDDTRVPPSFTPVVVVLYVVVVSLVLVLLAFLRGGHDWARHSIAAGAALTVFAVASALRTDPPAVFLAAALAILVLCVVLLVLLYLPTTHAFVGDLPEGPPDDA